MQDSIPEVPVPLLEEDGDAPLNLQQAFTRNYDDGGYKRLLNYTRPADPPLTGDADTWAHGLLQDQGLRRAEEG